MDHPHASVRIRRYESTPSKLKRRTSLLPVRLRMKSNPYVGSFRHSPPTTLRSMEAGLAPQPVTSPSSILRNSPYIGWFRHAPSSSIRLSKSDPLQWKYIDRFHQLAVLLDSLPRPEKSIPPLTERIVGRLYGGNTEESNRNLIDAVHHALQNQSSAKSNSAAVKILAKFGAWVLFPLSCEDFGEQSRSLKLLENNLSCTSKHCGSQEEEDSGDESDADSSSGESSIALSDFDGPGTPIAAQPTPAIKPPMDVSVSDVAEAYYAHHEVTSGNEPPLFALDGGLQHQDSRLDYEITQMDIARMARNASRHLDVDSIFNLPTVTYKSSGTKRALTDSRDPDEAFSFIMVSQVEQQQASHEPLEHETTCVICLEHFVDGDRLRILPCDHSFHVGCIDRWLSGSHSYHECFTSGCPTCKKRPTSHQSVSNDGSVPSWAFADLDAQMARSSGCLTPSE